MPFNYRAIVDAVNDFAVKYGLMAYEYTPNFKGIVEAIDNLQNLDLNNDGTNLSYTASTRALSSSTGTGTTLPEVIASGNSGLMTGADKSKLDGIQVDPNTGVVVLDADDIDDTSTTNKFVTASDVTALSTLSSDLAGKADLVGGVLDTSQLPDIAITEFKGSVASQAAMLAITGEKGDWVTRSDDGKVYVITGTDPSVIGGWTALTYPVASSSNLSYTSSTRVIGITGGTGATLPEVIAAGDSGLMTGADKTKLNGIETGAQVNTVTSVNGQTGAVTVNGSTDLSYTASTRVLASSTGNDATIPEVIAAGTSGLMTGADKTKLDGIAAGAEVNTVTSVNGQTGAVTITSGATNLSYTPSTRELTSSTGNTVTLPEVTASGDSGLLTGADKTKLDGIEASATADQTGAEIKSLYEAESDTNAFTDADHSKLDNLEIFGGNTTVTTATSTSVSPTVTSESTYNLEASTNTTTSVVTIRERFSGISGTAQAVLNAIGAAPANSTITFEVASFQGGGTFTYTVSSVTSSGTNSYDVTYSSVTASTTIPSGFVRLMNSQLSIPNYQVTLTGSLNPLFDDNRQVSINGVTYQKGKWTVTGTSATATFEASDPGIASGDSIVQSPGLIVSKSGSTDSVIPTYDSVPTNTNQLTNGAGFIGDSSGNGLVENGKYLGTKDGNGNANGYAIRFGQANKDTLNQVGRQILITDEASWTQFSELQASNPNVVNNFGILIGHQNNFDVAGGGNNVIIGEQTFGYGSRTTRTTSSSYNVVLGYQSAYNLTNHTSNVIIGHEAGYGRTVSGGGYNPTTYYPDNAYNNVFIGHRAGRDNCQGFNNIAIGYDSGTNNSPSGRLDNNSNVIVLGNNSISNFYCADTSISSSDERDKTDIEDFTAGLSFIEALRPVTYRWDKRSWYLPEREFADDDLSVLDMIPDGTHKRENLHIGFLAQEVESVEQAHGYSNNKYDRLIINLNEDETAYGIKYERLVPVLVNAIKELKAEINDINQRLSSEEPILLN
jgi:hypothetical protein